MAEGGQRERVVTTTGRWVSGRGAAAGGGRPAAAGAAASHGRSVVIGGGAQRLAESCQRQRAVSANRRWAGGGGAAADGESVSSAGLRRLGRHRGRRRLGCIVTGERSGAGHLGVADPPRRAATRYVVATQWATTALSVAEGSAGLVSKVTDCDYVRALVPWHCCAQRVPRRSRTSKATTGTSGPACWRLFRGCGGSRRIGLRRDRASPKPIGGYCGGGYLGVLAPGGGAVAGAPGGGTPDAPRRARRRLPRGGGSRTRHVLWWANVDSTPTVPADDGSVRRPLGPGHCHRRAGRLVCGCARLGAEGRGLAGRRRARAGFPLHAMRRRARRAHSRAGFACFAVRRARPGGGLRPLRARAPPHCCWVAMLPLWAGARAGPARAARVPNALVQLHAVRDALNRLGACCRHAHPPGCCGNRRCVAAALESRQHPPRQASARLAGLALQHMHGS